jgi:hypothetical protein
MATTKKDTAKAENVRQKDAQPEYDGNEGEQEPGVDVAKMTHQMTAEELENGGLPENRSDDRSMSLHIAKELPRHERTLELGGLDPADQQETFEYQVVTLPQGSAQETDPGPDNAAVTAAINAGYRTTGESVLEGPQDHPDGVSLVWTWKLPVIKVKGPVREGGLDNAKVSDRHDDGAKTPLENLADRDADAAAQSEEQAESEAEAARSTSGKSKAPRITSSKSAPR